MSRELECIVTPSVLDRLIDDDPHRSVDPPMTRAQSLRQFKQALKRDLEWLLNTRKTPEPASDALPGVSRSIFNYGLDDVSSMVVTSGADQNQLVSLLKSAVETYEPRIQCAHISMDPPSGLSRVLRFRIEGVVRVDPAPEHVEFDTVLELASGEYEVK